MRYERMKRDTVITCVEPNHRVRTMTTVLDGSYQQLDPYSDADGDRGGDDPEETPHESGVIIHVVPEGGKAKWNHIEDLDSFFIRMYHYHQNHGFACMMLQEICELGQFIFVVTFTTFLIHGVDYAILFKNKVVDNTHKTSLSDVIVPTSEALASMGLIDWTFIFIAGIVWVLQAVKVVYHLTQYWDIKMFFNIALKVDDNDLDNLTWHEVQRKVIEVQKEQEMCIHKRELTELDIYHRILRFKNYMVAMINKSLLPVKLKIPFLGECIFITKGLKYNMELLLFWGPWSPFENNWHLKEDYKKLNKRQELARALSKHILWVGIANLILCPFIFVWQILYSVFNYGELIKREPGALGIRMWSLYGRLYLRHFNELDHELNARLNRAYRPASKYMSSFTSPIMSVIAKNVEFIAGSILVVLALLTVYDEDVLTVEHVIATMTILGVLVVGARAFTPDENLVWCPETLLTAVLAHTHYRPDCWKGHAHTHSTRAQVAQLFQYRAVHLLEALLSPLLTPYILIVHMRIRALDIVDFYRNFTIEVTGVGDVCSFAQMDVRKHGNPMWQTVPSTPIEEEEAIDGYDNAYNREPQTLQVPQSNQYTQAEDGKTELSLIHFTLTNPEWKPPSHAETFVTALRERAKREVDIVPGDMNPLMASLNSLSSLGPGYNDIVANIIRNTVVNHTSVPSMSNIFANHPSMTSTSIGIDQTTSNRYDMQSSVVRRGMNRAEGPLHNERGLLYGLQQGLSNQSLGASVFGSGQEPTSDLSVPIELTAADMSLSTLYLHELHHRQVRRRGYSEMATRSIWPRSPVQELATLPEVRQERAPLLQHQDSSIRSHRDS